MKTLQSVHPLQTFKLLAGPHQLEHVNPKKQRPEGQGRKSMQGLPSIYPLNGYPGVRYSCY